MSEPMGGGVVQRTALVLAGLVILALTFTLGMLVGRQWGQPATQIVAAEPARKGAVPARRSGLADVEVERPKGVQERLTFYQTLTAPLGPSASHARAVPGEKGKAEARRPAEAQPTSRPDPQLAPRAEAGPKTEVSAAGPATAATGGGGTVGAQPPSGAGTWTVQVGAFRSRKQAEAVEKGLVAAGLPVEVSARAADDGQARYRVRVGSFGTRTDAERLAERLRAERSLATYVTTK